MAASFQESAWGKYMHRFMIALSCLAISLATIACAQEEAPDNNTRAVTVEKYGVACRVPQAWRLVGWAQDDAAFVLRLPQEKESHPGVVACELSLAPSSLDEFKKRHQAADEAEQKRAAENKTEPRRKLKENTISKLDPKQFNAERTRGWSDRLDSLWESPREDGAKNYELRTRIIRDDVLYTFVLESDGEHFEAYRLDFEEMLASVKLTAPDTGLQKMPSGYWLQKTYKFALELPDGWKPAFGPNDKVIFFAKGKTHEVFTDNLLVLASEKKGLDFDQLKTAMQQQLAVTHPAAKLEQRVVRFGPTGTEALETTIHFKQGPFELSILEWRFTGPSRNYEMKFTTTTKEFDVSAAAFRKSLESFVEVADEEPKEIQ
jgi:hypothetical protein